MLRRSSTKEWTGQRSRVYEPHIESLPCRIVSAGESKFKMYVPEAADIESETDVIEVVEDVKGEEVAHDLIIKYTSQGRGFDGSLHHLELTLEAMHLDVVTGIDDIPLSEL